ncbi:MAG: type II toxin-antitoxin system VapC family toxin [Nitrospirae bacterium]|nr:MAG: type II toxin-antitoxin system VapC family toxin [Nitrospirota bacterium]
MKRILIDTNAYAAFKKNDLRALQVFRTVDYIGIDVVVLGELLGGFKGGSKESKNKKELEQFLDSPRVYVIQMDEETAEFYAKIYFDLKRKGRPIPSNDIWVAASAMRHGLSLFTFDEHFSYIGGLILCNDW